MRPLARTDAILTEAVGNELIVYDQRTNAAHRLNATAAFLWRNCDGSRTVADLASLLHEIGLPDDQSLVSLALEPLEKQGLIKASLPVERVSRRDAIRRLRALGVAVALIPVVATIAVPPPSAAMSRHDPPQEDPPDFLDSQPTSGRHQRDPGTPDLLR
jgi:hypothetical protein